MELRHISLALSFLIFAFSLVTFIASVKYAIWSADSLSKDNPSAIPIIFYSGTIPLLTFAQTTLQIAFLEFPEYISSTFVCGISIFGALAWVVQASIWASCELSGGLPNKSSKTGTPSFCPQAVFVNHGGNLSAGLTAFKNAMAWIMMVAYLAMAFITFLGMRRTQMGRRRDEFHELVELPKDPTFAPGPRYRPYSSTFQRTEPEKVPAIKILSVSTRP